MQEYWNWSQHDTIALHNNTTFVWHGTNMPNMVTCLGGNLVVSAGATNSLNVWRRGITPIPTDAEITATVQQPKLDPVTNTYVFPMLLVRGATGSTFSGYRVNITETGAVLLRKTANTTSTTLAEAPIPNIGPNDWVNLRFRVQGSELKVKAWVAGSAEPNEWLLTATDTAFTSGRIGLLFWNQSTLTPHVVGPVGFATDGDSAPWHEQVITGRVVNDANPLQGLSRRVVAFERDTMAHMRTTTSDADGYFRLAVPTNLKCTVVVFDQTAGAKNAKIVDRIGGA